MTTQVPQGSITQVAPSTLVPGDVIPEGVVLRIEEFDFSLEVDGSHYVLTSTGALELAEADPVLLIARLDGEAFAEFLAAFDPGFLQ